MAFTLLGILALMFSLHAHPVAIAISAGACLWVLFFDTRAIIKDYSLKKHSI
ncbi:putative membrane protein [Corynebacterium deserti GIMN1.010]|uniref:Putative membrane protein n=1 Tax=Corynebacterium deserti GIMN1.010 TaxID=931089 RepID=A0A0M5IR27_9CORY|nr:hypothetical protein [Corynebacterium deserti]ALC05724.1 putative membrane protein [Corynebacterium deserti GIMN1.010]